MEKEYLEILSAFINKIKRERILFELQSEQKRERAFSKLSNFSECFNEKEISLDLSHLEEEQAIQAIERTIDKKDCFDLVYNEICPITKAYQRAVDSYMFDALIVDEHTVIYIGECEYGASEKYILRKEKML